MSEQPENSGISRREFLRWSALVPAAPVLDRAASVLGGQAPQKQSDIEKIFKGIRLTDQYGQPFDPALVLSDRTALLAFGYGGCPMCNQINKTIAHGQEALSRAGHDVPLIVVSVLPDQDNENAHTRKENIKSLFLSGIDLVSMATLKQIVTELEEKKAKEEKRDPVAAEKIIGDISGAGDVKREAREKLLRDYDIIDAIEAMENSQRKRLFNHVMPASSKDAQELQRRLAEIAGHRTSGVSASNPRQHTRYLTLLDRGQVVHPEGGPFIGVELNRRTESFEASPELIREQTERMVHTVDMLVQAHRREEASRKR